LLRRHATIDKLGHRNAGVDRLTDESLVRANASVPAGHLPDFREAFDSAPRPLLIVRADERYTMVAANRAHAAAFGSTPEELSGWGVFEVFPADPAPAIGAFIESIRTSFEEVLRTRRPHQMETRAFAIQSPGGEPAERYWSAINSPLCDDVGRVTHIISAVQDVTGEVKERRADEARDLLMREVDHRARNALTVVQTFVRLTAATTVDEFRTVLEGRVQALARAQTSLAARHWEGADLRQILEEELGPLFMSGRYMLEGPRLLLRADHVQTVSMFVHELATNACKYGALSDTCGRLSVRWRPEADGALVLDWSEADGPPTKPPSRGGFGTRLMQQLARQLGGEATFNWRTEGLRVRLRIPVATDYIPA
jgi:PAS domain S-box-containing protein